MKLARLTAFFAYWSWWRWWAESVQFLIFPASMMEPLSKMRDRAYANVAFPRPIAIYIRLPFECSHDSLLQFRIGIDPFPLFSRFADGRMVWIKAPCQLEVRLILFRPSYGS